MTAAAGKGAVGIDLGASHVCGLRIGGSCRIESYLETKFPRRAGKEDILQAVLDCARGVADDRIRALRGFGIGLPGAVRDGVLFRSPNLPCLEGTDFAKMLRKEFGRGVAVDNDANCLAYGESVRNGAKNLIAVTLGTGVGGGIVIGGEVYRGRSNAGEFGHVPIDPDGRKCSCGARGCLEEYVSARGIAKLSEEITGKRAEPHDLRGRAKDGDKKALEVWREYGRLLGAGLSGIIFSFDPELVVIGGGIAGAYDLFGKSMEKELKRRVFLPLPGIRTADYGANAFGAACMALDARQE